MPKPHLSPKTSTNTHELYNLILTQRRPRTPLLAPALGTRSTLPFTSAAAPMARPPTARNILHHRATKSHRPFARLTRLRLPVSVRVPAGRGPYYVGCVWCFYLFAAVPVWRVATVGTWQRYTCGRGRASERATGLWPGLLCCCRRRDRPCGVKASVVVRCML